MEAARRALIPRILYGLSAVLAVPWFWTSVRTPTREAVIAWLVLTASIGVLWLVAGVLLVARSRGVARWGGGVSVLVGGGLVVLAVAMIEIAHESTWAV